MITLKMGIQNKTNKQTKPSKLMDSGNRLVIARGRDQD